MSKAFLRRPQGPLVSRLFLPLFLLLLALATSPGPWAQEPEAEPEVAEAGGEDSASEDQEGEEISDEASIDDGTPGKVLVIRIDSAIHPVAAEYVAESLERADSMKARAAVIEINTPGGLLSSTREITKSMLSARTPVVVYVAPSGAQAASAGFFILMAADVAAMAPGTNTGAAHPVGGQGEDIEGHMGKKIEEDSAATIRSLARQHGRNVELAEAAVLESRSFTAEEALEEGLVEVLAPSLDQLLDRVDGMEIEKLGEERIALRTAGAVVERREMPGIQRFLSVLTDPQVAAILMFLGTLGIYMEITNPGSLLPGVVGSICLILGFYAFSVLPVNFAGIALILLGVVLFFAETQVPSFGVLSLGGAVSLVIGGLMLFKDVGPAFQSSPLPLMVVGGMVSAVMATLSFKAIQVRRSPITTGKEGLVGEVGVARTALAPSGKVFVHGELWNSISESPVAPGASVEVVAVDGLSLRVRPEAGTEGAAPPAS